MKDIATTGRQFLTLALLVTGGVTVAWLALSATRGGNRQALAVASALVLSALAGSAWWKLRRMHAERRLQAALSAYAERQMARDQGDRAAEGLAAELTEAAYAVMLRHGEIGSSVDLELDLWRTLTGTVQRNQHSGRATQT